MLVLYQYHQWRATVPSKAPQEIVI